MATTIARDLVARVAITIDAPRSAVWAALVDQSAVKEYMFGAEVASSWKEGDPITWSGEWEGKRYQDKGVIERIEPERTLAHTHFSPLSGQTDRPENYHRVTIELSDVGDGTRVVLTQDNNPTEDAKTHSERNWAAMLDGLKKHVEERTSGR